MEDLFTRRTSDETPAYVEAILFLDHELRRRDQTLAALNDEQAQTWVEVLLLHDPVERNDLVEDAFGPRLTFCALDAHEKFGQIELRDMMYRTPSPAPKRVLLDSTKTWSETILQIQHHLPHRNMPRVWLIR